MVEGHYWWSVTILHGILQGNIHTLMVADVFTRDRMARRVAHSWTHLLVTDGAICRSC